ncbi:MAG: FAD-dependent oxidoreductase, partial [bacterium]|nr:FAD-dependent oxidoreductase [bacterium]
MIEEFEYPKFGPGMMWEKCHDLVIDQGNEVLLNHKVKRFLHQDGKVVSVQADGPKGPVEFASDSIISSMPLPHLLQAMDPPASEETLKAASSLTFRDFLTVALIVPEEKGFPDNWIYIHSEEVKVGRVQNFGQWSPYLVKEGRTCLGLEYFVNIG